MNGEMLLYEELSLNAHPALQTQLYDGWVLRFANGYTSRANSVNLLYPSALDPQTKITACEEQYFAQGLPAAFKLTDGAGPGMDALLARRGYTLATPAYVMKMDLRGRTFESDSFVSTSYADKAWLVAYFTFSNYHGTAKTTAARQILKNNKNSMICGRIVKDGLPVACGSSVVERGYAGLLNIVVDAPRRGKGYGRGLCESLLAESKRLGAHTAYLQVARENEKAVSLYTKLGFTTIYSYWYRVKERKPL
ncbi:MAG: GNAT family N-acetyltransferase [Firmicutes bacterium]|nr:GNAT family N-acetyltransferase [Bacillota bacterium]